MATGSVEDVRSRLKLHFANDSADQPARWAKLWEQQDFLPWDRGMPNPTLTDTLIQQQDLLGTCFKDDAKGGKRRKKALVPGCGRGYDVLLLASFGYDAYGLEVSAEAVELCLQERKENGHKYPVKDEAAGPGEAKFLEGDFFQEDWTAQIEEDPSFDLIYDYTFLCALPAKLRSSWSLRHSQLLDPFGNLVCVEFPTHKEPSTGGPPYGVPPETYAEHLNHPGENIPYDDKGYVKVGALGQAGPQALIRIAHWQPKRTHEIGKGTDWEMSH